MIRPTVLCCLVLFVAAASVCAAPQAEPQDLKIMSFNIRFSRGANEAKAENNWADAQHPRRDRTIAVIREYDPDLLGVQEARFPQIADLREALPKHAFYGVGRDDGKEAGEFTGIFYRKDRFKRLDDGSFWLSATPNKPATSFYTAPGAVPRMSSWVRLRDKATGQEFVLLNTHWDHISGPARRKSAALIRERLAKVAPDMPVIVMGDLNSSEDSPATTELVAGTDSANGTLIDSYRSLHPKRVPNEATFNSWNGSTHGSRIDFILHSDDFKPVAADIVRTSYEGRWPSDHYPVTATLRLSQ